MRKKKTPNPDKPLTITEFNGMKWEKGWDGLASLIGEKAVAPMRSRGRPKSEHPKAHVNIRIDADILSILRKSGTGWQTRLNSILRQAISEGLI